MIYTPDIKGEEKEVRTVTAMFEQPVMVGLAPKWVRLAPNGTNPGLFQIRFQCIWRPGQSDPLWSQTYHPWLELYEATKSNN